MKVERAVRSVLVAWYNRGKKDELSGAAIENVVF